MGAPAARLTSPALLSLRERLASLTEGASTYSRPPRPRERLPPRGFEECGTPFGPAWKRVDFVVAGPGTDPPHCAYFDVETTGLSGGAGTLMFAAAMALPVGNGLEVTQLFLQEPGAEAAFLHELTAGLQASKRVATYNGRRFDIPVLRNRLFIAGLNRELPAEHLDLLDMTRPLLRSTLGSCALRNVELRLLRFEREEDLPSYLVPEAYFSYLRWGRCSELEAALAHNRQDVISLFHVHRRVVERLAGMPEQLNAAELLALGRFHLRQGRKAAGVRALRRAVELDEGACSQEAALLLARTLLRRHQPALAHRVLVEAGASNPLTALLVARARILEWRLRDCAGALEAVDIALRNPATLDLRQDLMLRRTRLQRKLSRRGREGPRLVSV